ncbi:hypothetical protein CHLNCDRAFT_21564 [Chlorella variabilis]|uniref:peptidylprolyl isomerase n=1 Tax=Chlorella variabilis TaxID=554065 RepID=E1ZB61_CHLVA|nr:hypothetical protein CHLNCDRAFT_21564 [Chlorella variabilis]EFN56968.1 hypothetical protein CHLNCDRAFT_21564 [Chlorella variabilis]|eukprot:XP_005849070.1 hypothetical protein CHLNCDRAFT_21564 [Chlorella variabilis]
MPLCPPPLEQQPTCPVVWRRRRFLGSAQDARLLAETVCPCPCLCEPGAWHAGCRVAPALAVDDEPPPVLCDEACAAGLEGRERVTTASGLQYIDLVQGRGPSPPRGYQVTGELHYVAMTPDGRVFDSSLAKGYPYQIRVGAEQVVAGLDEGLLTMSVGGLRRIYVPGSLAYPRGLPAAAGRPRVAPSTPVMFDVKLLYIPGITDDEEDE